MSCTATVACDNAMNCTVVENISTRHHGHIALMTNSDCVVSQYEYANAARPPSHAGLRKYYRLNFDLMVDVVWIVALIVVILVKDGPMLFA